MEDIKKIIFRRKAYGLFLFDYSKYLIKVNNQMVGLIEQDGEFTYNTTDHHNTIVVEKINAGNYDRNTIESNPYTFDFNNTNTVTIENGLTKHYYAFSIFGIIGLILTCLLLFVNLLFIILQISFTIIIVMVSLYFMYTPGKIIEVKEISRK